MNIKTTFIVIGIFITLLFGSGAYARCPNSDTSGVLIINKIKDDVNIVYRAVEDSREFTKIIKVLKGYKILGTTEAFCAKIGTFVRIDSKIRVNGNLTIVKDQLKFIVISDDEITADEYEMQK